MRISNEVINRKCTYRILTTAHRFFITRLMIELIKSKQDDVITKALIRSRKLDQSMLRFTRIYRDAQGKFQQDANSIEYSCIMTESTKAEEESIQ